MRGQVYPNSTPTSPQLYRIDSGLLAVCSYSGGIVVETVNPVIIRLQYLFVFCRFQNHCIHKSLTLFLAFTQTPLCTQE